MNTHIFALSSFLAALTIPSQAITVALSPDEDNTIYQEDGALSNGAGEFLFVGTTAGRINTQARRALLSFDVAAIVPAGATINSATVRLRLSKSISGIQTVSLHRLTNDWGAAASDAGGQEGQGTNALAGDATWSNNVTGTSAWSTAGGDFISGASATQTVSNTAGDFDWNSTGTTVADVQGWLDNPAQNFGWILVGDESVTTTAKRFNSADNASNQPMLLLDYTPVPEPSTALLGLVGLGLLARRRRLSNF